MLSRAGNRTRHTLMENKCSSHCPNPAAKHFSDISGRRQGERKRQPDFEPTNSGQTISQKNTHFLTSSGFICFYIYCSSFLTSSTAWFNMHKIKNTTSIFLFVWSSSLQFGEWRGEVHIHRTPRPSSSPKNKYRKTPIIFRKTNCDTT